MTIGLLPVTGITLPFMSYGGSSLVFSFAMVGLTINFASRRKRFGARASFEFDGDPRAAQIEGGRWQRAQRFNQESQPRRKRSGLRKVLS